MARVRDDNEGIVLSTQEARVLEDQIEARTPNWLTVRVFRNGEIRVRITRGYAFPYADFEGDADSISGAIMDFVSLSLREMRAHLRARLKR